MERQCESIAPTYGPGLWAGTALKASEALERCLAEQSPRMKSVLSMTIWCKTRSLDSHVFYVIICFFIVSLPSASVGDEEVAELLLSQPACAMHGDDEALAE